MELHAEQGPAFMLQRHRNPVFRASRHNEITRQGHFIDDQRVIPHRAKRIGEIGKQTTLVVFNPRSSPVDWLVGANDLSAECRRDRLMPEADTEDWNRRSQFADDWH